MTDHKDLLVQIQELDAHITRLLESANGLRKELNERHVLAGNCK